LVNVLLATIKTEAFYFLSSLHKDEGNIFFDSIKYNICFFGFEEIDVTVSLGSISKRDKIVFTTGTFLIYFAK